MNEFIKRQNQKLSLRRWGSGSLGGARKCQLEVKCFRGFQCGSNNKADTESGLMSENEQATLNNASNYRINGITDRWFRVRGPISSSSSTTSSTSFITPNGST